MLIEQLNFNTSLLKTLQRAGITEVHELLSLTDEEILRIRGVGYVNLQKIKEKLKEIKEMAQENVNNNDLKNYMLVHKDTDVICCNCGYDYIIELTKEYSQDEPHLRICKYCIEKLSNN